MRRRAGSLALAGALLASCSCGSNGKDAAKPAPDVSRPATPAPAARSAPLTALRPELKFSDGRTSRAGVGFLPASSRPLAVVSTHVVMSLLKGGQLTGIDLVDAQSRAAVARGQGLAIPAGPPMDGFDFSTDFGIVLLDAAPEGIARVGLDPERPKVGDAVEVLACPTDGSTPQVTIAGEVSYAGSDRLEVRLANPGSTRGMAGSPVVSRRTGLVVGVLQTAQVGNGGVGLGRATPAEAVRKKLAEAEAAKQPVPFATWTGR